MRSCALHDFLPIPPPQREAADGHDREADEEKDDQKVAFALRQREVMHLCGRYVDDPRGGGRHDA